MLQLKIEVGDTLRRVSVPRNTSLTDAKAAVAAVLGAPADALVFKYRDEDGDLITVGSEPEWHAASANVKDGAVLRLIVSVGGSGAPTPSAPAAAPTAPAATPQAAQAQAPPAPPPPPEVPFIGLARALADPAIVARILASASSPIVQDAVTSVARAYAETRGDVLASWLVAAQHAPLLHGLLHELLHDVPALREVPGAFSQFGGGAAPGLRGMFGGGPGCPRAGMGPGMCRTVHPGVFCDGCQGDPALKRTSFANGHMTRRGFINGIRYKSQTVHDFDLCESCHKSGQFTENAYGPFTVIHPPAAAGGAPRCHGGWWAARGAGEDENWRERPQHCHPHPPPPPHGHPHHHHPPHHAPHGHPVPPPQPPAPPAETAPKSFDFFGDVLRDAISKGASAVAEATKDEDNEFAEIARAIAESLKKPAQAAAAAAAPPATETTTTTEKPVAAPSTSTTASGDVSGDEWEAVARDDPFVKWSKELAQLQNLGFTESETYVKFLEEERGDLDRVVSRIVSRNA